MFPYIWLFSEDDNLIIYKYYYEITVSQTNEVKGVNTGVSRFAVGLLVKCCVSNSSYKSST